LTARRSFKTSDRSADLRSIDLIFGKKQTFDFNSISKILHLHGNVAENTNAIIQTYQKLDLETTPVSSGAFSYHEENIYNEKWIKRMAVARAMRQWGINIGLKYQGSVLPNGGSINGEGIITMGETQIEKLLAELDSDFTLPIDFFVG